MQNHDDASAFGWPRLCLHVRRNSKRISAPLLHSLKNCITTLLLLQLNLNRRLSLMHQKERDLKIRQMATSPFLHLFIKGEHTHINPSYVFENNPPLAGPCLVSIENALNLHGQEVGKNCNANVRLHEYGLIKREARYLKRGPI